MRPHLLPLAIFTFGATTACDTMGPSATPLGGYELLTISGRRLPGETQDLGDRQETLVSDTLHVGLPTGTYKVTSIIRVLQGGSIQNVRRVTRGLLEHQADGTWRIPDFHGGSATFRWPGGVLGLTLRASDGREWGYWSCYC